MLFFYNLFLVFFQVALRLASLWNPKARLWVEGRKSILSRIHQACAKDTRPLIWMHCASLGEFEQGRPVLEAIRSRYPQYRMLLTFFSPSGYEIRKNYPGADLVFYLPLDGPSTSPAFVAAIQPAAALFIKYESWYYYLDALQQRHVPTLLISAIFRPSQQFFGAFGTFLRGMLAQYDQLFLQDALSKTTLENAGVTVPATVAGDTRFDRVTGVVQQDFQHPYIERFCYDSTVLVAGSTWPEDEVLLKKLLEAIPTLKMVVAPHNIDARSVTATRDLFGTAEILSEVGKYETKDFKQDFTQDLATSQQARVLILDEMGILSMVYRYSTICYIGGGFNKAGIHNILEAAAYDRVVVFGPQHKRSAEAARLMALGAGFSIGHASQLIDAMSRLLKDIPSREEKNQLAGNFVRSNTGATQHIMDFIEKNKILVPNKVLD